MCDKTSQSSETTVLDAAPQALSDDEMNQIHAGANSQRRTLSGPSIPGSKLPAWAGSVTVTTTVSPTTVSRNRS